MRASASSRLPAGEPARSKMGVTWQDLKAVKGELLVVAATVGLFFASLANTPWEVVLPLCSICLVVSGLLLGTETWHMVKTRTVDYPRVTLVVLDTVVVAASCGILYLWGQVQTDQVDDAVTGVAYALDTIMLIVSVTTCVSRLIMRARDRRRSELEAEMLGQQMGDTVTL